jgi:predicted Zn-dependent protease with MMP-like domain
MASLDLKSLLPLAEAEVKSVIASLPEDLQREAERLPISYDSRNEEELRKDDLDETLGLFVGASHLDGLGEGDNLPPQIILFLVNIWLFAEEDEAAYREEIRTTYLHELGHYLGLEEIDLEERGLL